MRQAAANFGRRCPLRRRERPDPAICKADPSRPIRRALCFLDPYKIMLDWNVLVEAARMSTIETFIHFPTGDIQRNVLRRRQDTVEPVDVARMNLMWGDNSWRKRSVRQ